MQIAFGRVRRKTEPTGLGATTVILSKIDTYDWVREPHLSDLVPKVVVFLTRTCQ